MESIGESKTERQTKGVKVTWLKILCVIFSIVSLILAIFPMIGSTSTSSSIAQIYQVKLDFTNVNFTELIPVQRYNSITSNLTLEEAGISPIYTIGAQSFCRAHKDNKNNLHFDSCTKNFVPDPIAMVVHDIHEYGISELQKVSWYTVYFPYNMPDFTENPDHDNIKALYYLIIVGVALNAVAILFFVAAVTIPMTFPFFEIGLFFDMGPLICYITAAVCSIGLIARTVDGINRERKEFGIHATFGNARFHILLWIAMGLHLVLVVLYTCKKCGAFRKEQKKYTDIEINHLEDRNKEATRLKPPKDLEAEKRMQELYDKLYAYQLEQEHSLDGKSTIQHTERFFFNEKTPKDLENKEDEKEYADAPAYSPNEKKYVKTDLIQYNVRN